MRLLERVPSQFVKLLTCLRHTSVGLLNPTFQRHLLDEEEHMSLVRSAFVVRMIVDCI